MRSFIVCTLVILSVGSRAFAADRCHLREIDLCAAAGAGAAKVPANEAEVDKYCEVGREAKECVQTYVNNCATPLQKELLEFLSAGAKSTGEKFCKKGSDVREGYLKHAPCLARAQPEGKICIVDVHAGLERLEEVKLEDRVPTACCIYTRYQKCTKDIVEARCGKEAIQYGQVVLKLAAGNVLGVMCKGFDNNPKCDRLLPAPGTKPKGNSKSVITKLFKAYSAGNS